MEYKYINAPKPNRRAVIKTKTGWWNNFYELRQRRDVHEHTKDINVHQPFGSTYHSSWIARGHLDEAALETNNPKGNDWLNRKYYFKTFKESFQVQRYKYGTILSKDIVYQLLWGSLKLMLV